jgi:hypothetical protein
VELQVGREWPNLQAIRRNCGRQSGDVQDGKRGSPRFDDSDTNRTQGLFSGDKSNKYQVDKEGLQQLTVERLAEGLQSKPGNEMAGIEGRAQLLMRLGKALAEKTEFFGEDGRPGSMLGKCSHVAVVVPLLT